MSTATEPREGQSKGQSKAESILNAVIALEPEIRACRDEMDRERKLPPHLVAALKKAGAFSMTMPQEWGGAELDPVSQLPIIEALSKADASVGWCTMIGSDSGYFSGFIEQKTAREMYRDIDAVTASALTTTGRAVKTEGGYRVSGRMPFSSGCHHSDWFVLGCQVYDGEQLQLLPNGIPVTRQCFVPADAITIVDTWNTTGLWGTGSNDLIVDECFVLQEKTFSFQAPSFYRANPLYCFPFNFLLNFAAVPLGVAQAALDCLLQAGERPTRTLTLNGEMVPPRVLRDEAFVQDTVGKASAMLSSTRAYVHTTIDGLWTTLKTQQEMSPHQFADFQVLNTYVFETCTEVVKMLYKIRGGTSVYTGNELDRCLRDILTMNQHVMSSLRFYTAAGRVLLGLPPEQMLL